jgi:hypothetical protein
MINPAKHPRIQEKHGAIFGAGFAKGTGAKVAIKAKVIQMTLTEEMAIPCFARRVVQSGPVPGRMNPRLRNGVEQIWTLAPDVPAHDPRIAETTVDCLIVAVDSGGMEEMTQRLDHLNDILGPEGQALLLFVPPARPTVDLRVLDEILLRYTWMRYHTGELAGDAGRPAVWALTAVRAGYNPVEHARRVAAQGRPDCAIDIIKAIPDQLVPDAETLARLALEKQRHYFRWQEQRAGTDAPYALFSKARREFAQVTALRPALWESYELHARYWTFLGRDDMAGRVRRSVAHMSGTSGVTPERSLFPQGPEEGGAQELGVPEWDGSRRPPRILILTHDFSDYGLDSLYHGLCTVIGPDNVVEFPWKPTLHGKNREATQGYPCFFDYPGKPMTVLSLVRELEQGRFDLILHADVVQMAHQDEVQRLAAAAPHVPVLLYDTWDDCYTPIRRVLEYIGRPGLALCFKREMLNGVEYAPMSFPLPFGYPETLASSGDDTRRKRPIFWAGKNEYGLRPLYIPALEKQLGEPLDRRFDQNEYRRVLGASRIGLSFFGCGFDTVRYWELPAHGVMLLAERPPIRIPFNYQEGHSAVFFDDLPQMLNKLDLYLDQPQKTQQIARNGRIHYLRYHTSTARARQFLGRAALHLKW